ncbi:MAG: nucleoside triphosphate pyrophosphohydrolase [Chitinophagaceae bacterium]
MSKSYLISFEKLVNIMDDLREKCPWDKKQTIHTLRNMTLEETYELIDGIDNNDWDNIKEELGDLILHILFYTKIASEQNNFYLNDVLETICEKLIRRHPHIYGDVEVENSEQVKQNWEAIKQQEKERKYIFDGFPRALPAIQKAIKIQEKAKTVGFEWDNKEDVFAKVNEEIDELQQALQTNNQQHIEEEFGDVLFSLINYSRFIGVDAELALNKVNQKFINRFTKMESHAKNLNKDLSDLSLAEMDAIWNLVKKQTS